MTPLQIVLLLATLWAPPLAYMAGLRLAERWHRHCIRAAYRRAHTARIPSPRRAA